MQIGHWKQLRVHLQSLHCMISYHPDRHIPHVREKQEAKHVKACTIWFATLGKLAGH